MSGLVPKETSGANVMGSTRQSFHFNTRLRTRNSMFKNVREIHPILKLRTPSSHGGQFHGLPFYAVEEPILDFKNTDANRPFPKVRKPLLSGWMGGWWSKASFDFQIQNMLAELIPNLASKVAHGNYTKTHLIYV